ncbi:MAG TPA: hypothetical protein VIR77_03360 [Pontiella sp.]
MSMEKTAEKHEHHLIGKLLHLKSYETPEHARMLRSRQNIIREIRNTQARRRPSVGDLLESYVPWFFAEPKYGIALLFVAFVALQYAGTTARNSARSTGIYTSNGDIAAYESAVNISTNPAVYYPALPSNYQLFGEQPSSDKGMLVERLSRK